jgi:2-hydroxychromene-2-carboxylate isomerase
MRDTVRVAESLGIPYAWPQPDPVATDRKTRTFPEEQPYIHRLTRLGVAAAERGRGLPFMDEVSRIIFSGSIRGWDEGSHLADATARAGLNLAELDGAIEAAERYDAIVEQNQKDLEAAGHWGVPTMVFRDEPFFGQDRLDLLLWRLTQHGLESRSDP